MEKDPDGCAKRAVNAGLLPQLASSDDPGESSWV
jgi:hypothetical protein